MIDLQFVQRSSIIRKLAIIFLVFILAFFAFGFAAVYIFKTELGEYVNDFQRYKVEEETEKVDNFIDDLAADLKSFYVIKDDLAKNDFSLTITHIYQLFLVDKGIKEVEIISPEGMEMLGVSRIGMIPKEVLKNVKNENYFKIAKLDKVFISDVYLENNRSAIIDIAIPYFENFKLLAVVRAKIDLSDFLGGIIAETTFASGHIHTLSKDGIMLSSPTLEDIGKDFSAIPFIKDLKKNGAKGIFGVSCQSCVEKHNFDIIVSAKQIKNPLGLYVVLESNKDEVFSGYYRVRNILFAAGFFALIFLLIFIWLVNARIKNYLALFVKGIDNFHQGKFDEKIVINTGDELEYFAQHFNHLASELSRTIGKLKEEDIMRYSFIKTISHQLRTPISSMMWLLETLIGQMEGKIGLEQLDIFKDIYKASRNIGQIINDMLLMAEIDDNKVSLDKSTANYDDIIGSAMFEMQEQILPKNISIDYEKSRVPLPPCEGDVKKIKFVIYRLLDNAAKYSESGKKIIIRTEIKNKELIFSVIDEGIGIPEDEKPRVFTKFYRASNAYKILQDASGLSLYIAKYFVELHGGKIWFESKEGKGSTFYFSLPVKN